MVQWMHLTNPENWMLSGFCWTFIDIMSYRNISYFIDNFDLSNWPWIKVTLNCLVINNLFLKYELPLSIRSTTNISNIFTSDLDLLTIQVKTLFGHQFLCQVWTSTIPPMGVINLWNTTHGPWRKMSKLNISFTHFIC